MLLILAIDATLLKKYLNLFYFFFASRFPNKPHSKNPQGSKRKFDFCLLVALALLKEMLIFSWRQFAEQIPQHQTILIHFKAKQVPSYGSIYAAWTEINEAKLGRMLVKLGRHLYQNPPKTAVDSTGVLFKAGTVWPLLTWTKSRPKKKLSGKSIS